MNDGDVPNDDMPNFMRPGRHASPISDAALAALLAGTDPPAAQAAPGLQPVADVVAALKADPTGDELAGEALALAEFRRAAGVSVPSHRRRRRSGAVSTSPLGARAAVAGLAAVLSLGGLATAAFAGVLPRPIQQFAHDAIGAPASPGSRADADHAKTAVGPDATGHAAFGLCNAYAHAKEHGTATQRAVAFRNLAKAARGSGNIVGYCAGVPHPGAPRPHGKHSPQPTPQPTGKPTAHPGKPTAHPTPHPHPTPHRHPTGKPTAHT